MSHRNSECFQSRGIDRSRQEGGAVAALLHHGHPAHRGSSGEQTDLTSEALCFAISLVLSNMAYKYSSVAFLQMIKEGGSPELGSRAVHDF